MSSTEIMRAWTGCSWLRIVLKWMLDRLIVRTWTAFRWLGRLSAALVAVSHRWWLSRKELRRKRQHQLCLRFESSAATDAVESSRAISRVRQDFISNVSGISLAHSSSSVTYAETTCEKLGSLYSHTADRIEDFVANSTCHLVYNL